MTKAYRYLSESQKRRAVGRVASGEAVSTVARSIGVNRNRPYEWCRKYQEGGTEAVRRVGRPRQAESARARTPTPNLPLDPKTRQAQAMT